MECYALRNRERNPRPKERDMAACNWIGMDVHSSFYEGGWMNNRGQEKGSFHVATRIPALVAELEKVAKPRVVVMEEGPLAEWLNRELSPFVDRVIVTDPYRNALIRLTGGSWRSLLAEDMCVRFITMTI